MTGCSEGDVYFESSRSRTTEVTTTTTRTTQGRLYCCSSIQEESSRVMSDVLMGRQDVSSRLSPSSPDVSSPSSRRAALILLAVFATAVFSLYLVYYNFPKLDPSEVIYVKVPKNLEDAKRLGLVLNRYKDQYYLTVLMGVVVTYVFLQSFAIPGSLFLTILSGYLFPFPVALFLVCFCSAVGAGLCYLLFNVFGRPLVIKWFPDKVSNWSVQVRKQRDNLLSYIIFLRITPILPNWFINVSSPVIDVPFTPFFWGTLLGVAPPSFVYIGAGKTLQELNSAGIISTKAMIVLFALAFTFVLPGIFKYFGLIQKNGDEEGKKKED